ncbi:MAG: hypothetical protein GX489_07940 [Firmicutes bacterium]|nr:hypothetical protein [Bacillota bacterium]
MRRLLVIIVLCFVIVSGYYYIRREPDAALAYNPTNLIPYEVVTGLRLEPKV